MSKLKADINAEQEMYKSCLQNILHKNSVTQPEAYIHTFGCQQNISDTENIIAILKGIGYTISDNYNNADLILFNTCAVREHAEDRVFGNVGRLKTHLKSKPDCIIILCGCMMQQGHIAEKVRKSYPFVDIVFGTNLVHKLPQYIYHVLTEGRIFDLDNNDDIIEGDVDVQNGIIKGNLSIINGCNNFCSYCIVPYVRGRERSRSPENILAQAKKMIDAGCKEITLLGQNVNSYGRDSDFNIDFCEILKQICDIEGDFLVRFLTSHPKDCTKELIDTISTNAKIENHIHLPVQSGSNEILKAMNRSYTRESYMELAGYAKSKIPELILSSDIIIGFPGETEKDFDDTLKLIRDVEYKTLYTYIYSPRIGTPAEKISDNISRAIKNKRFDELLALQEKISTHLSELMLNTKQRVLVEKADEKQLFGKTRSGVNVQFVGDAKLISQFVDVTITNSGTWVLTGEIIKN